MTLKVLCIGQIGWDITTIGNKKFKNYGGSVLHFSLAAALMGVTADLLCYVNKKKWGLLINELHQIGIGTQHIIDFEHTIHFNMYYDEALNFCEEKFSMDINENEPNICKKLVNMQMYDLYNICETVPEQDFMTLQTIKKYNENAIIAMQFHIDNLLKNKDLYLSLLGELDYIFMNVDEALFLSNEDTIENAIDFLRHRVKKVVFITSHVKNYAITKNESIEMFPIQTNVIVDPTGAGDCFAGGAIAGLCSDGKLETALRFGGICSYFKLMGYSSSYLFDILKVWRT